MSGQETITLQDRIVAALAELIGEDEARRLWEQGHGPPPPPDTRPTLQGAVRTAVDAWVVERCGERDADESLAVMVDAVNLVMALEDVTECGWLSVLQAVRGAATDALADRAP